MDASDLTGWRQPQENTHMVIKLLQPGTEWVHALTDISLSALSTKPVHWLQICPTVHN